MRIVVVLLAVFSGSAGVSSADTILFDFDGISPCSCNPRGGWFGFGAGTTDRGISSSGSVGNAAYHSIDWDESTWGVGDVTTSAVDLSEYSGVSFDARLVPDAGHTGTAKIRFALDMPSGEWTTSSVPLGTGWQTYIVAFDELSGPGTLDLASGEMKIIVEKNGQAGRATVLFDEITGVGGSVDALTPVVLNPPPDGDAVRAMWFYAGSYFQSLTSLQEVLEFCKREGVNQIYCGAYPVWRFGTQVEKDNLREFVRIAHESGIIVEALLDGLNWHQNPSTAETHIDQILAFQNATPTEEDDFDAIHFDMEFWLHDSWDTGITGREEVARQYLDNVLVTAREHLDANGETGMKISVDLYAHFDTSGSLPNMFTWNGVTQYFIEHVLDHTDTVVLMSYYDSATALANVTNAELDMAYGKGRTIVLGADIQPSPPEVSSNTFGDNFPDPYADMTQELELFHERLAASRLQSLEGFSVFYYDGWKTHAPKPGHLADLDGDNDVDMNDFVSFEEYLFGPGIPADGLNRDADFDRDGDVDLADYSIFTTCFTGAGSAAPMNTDCRK